MSQGIFVNRQRPQSKKAIREAVAADPARVRVEATAMIGNEYDGLVSDLPEKFRPISFVGPDPYRNRKYYGTISRKADGAIVVK